MGVEGHMSRLSKRYSSVRLDGENHEGFLFRNAQTLRWANMLSAVFSQITKKFLRVIAELTVNRNRLVGPICHRKHYQE
jgi:hypothetical protein